MATRSRIGVMHGDVIKHVYCHWDGYPSHNGDILLKNYNSAKANELVSLGDISSLRPEIGVEHPFSRFETQISDAEYDRLYGDMTTFYHRDRGEEQAKDWRVSTTFEDFLDAVEGCWGEWYYVMKDGEWFVGNIYERDARHYRKLVSLKESLEIETAEEAV